MFLVCVCVFFYNRIALPFQRRTAWNLAKMCFGVQCISRRLPCFKPDEKYIVYYDGLVSLLCFLRWPSTGKRRSAPASSTCLRTLFGETPEIAALPYCCGAINISLK